MSVAVVVRHDTLPERTRDLWEGKAVGREVLPEEKRMKHDVPALGVVLSVAEHVQRGRQRRRVLEPLIISHRGHEVRHAIVRGRVVSVAGHGPNDGCTRYPLAMLKSAAWIFGSSLLLAGVGATLLSVPVLGWVLLGIAGAGVVLSGALAALGVGPYRRGAQATRLKRRHDLENERDRLNAELVRLEGDAAVSKQYKSVADDYGDAPRSGVLAGELARFDARRAEIGRRLEQVALELNSL